jgi:hypothetical protein
MKTNHGRHFISLLSLAILCSALLACDQKADSTKSGKAAAVPAEPAADVQKTNALFQLATDKELGDKVGLFELRQNGILIHPGETKPSKISFKLAAAYNTLTLRTFISALPDNAPLKDAGTVGVEFLLDGKSTGRVNVDRNSKKVDTLDVAGVQVLTVIVDNGDGKSWFDWLTLAVLAAK